jgi:predicted anti-sigma-YlaC factor YlaD
LKKAIMKTSPVGNIINAAARIFSRGSRYVSADGDAACEVVRDLIPLYADGVANEHTRSFVNAHLSGCSECADFYRSVKAATREARATGRTGRLGVGGFANVAGRIRRRRAIYATAASLALLLSLCFNLYIFFNRGTDR